MADETQSYAVFNSQALIDTVGDSASAGLEASRLKKFISVLGGRFFNWGQRKSLFPVH